VLRFATTARRDPSEAPSKSPWFPPAASRTTRSRITQQTVKFHLTNIYRKLGVKNRTEATRLAYQQGLVESPLYDEE